jgi:hypothetical protein
VGNSAPFAEFSKRSGNGGKHVVRFPRFPRRGSFHSQRSKKYIFPVGTQKLEPDFAANEFLANSAWSGLRF